MNEHFTVLDAKRRAEELRKQLHAHAHAYYNLGQPTATDAEYDALFNELKELESRWPQIEDPNSPTVRVGSPVMAGFAKVKHEKKMLSLDNAYTAEEVVKFFKGVSGDFSGNLIVEPKFDGCSLSLHYAKGHLVKAVTRGDGTTGDDVTQNARSIRSIPLQLPFPISVEVRGEVFMSLTAFNSGNEELAKAGEDLFANPRNAAAGTLKNRDSRIVAKRHLSFVAYNAALPGTLVQNYVSAINATAKKPFTMSNTHGSVLKALEGLAFWTPLSLCTINSDTIEVFRIVHASDTAGIATIITDLDKIRETLNVQTDGLVFKINDLVSQDALGDGTRSPRWATAYKYPPERKTTLLENVEVSIGRLGTITPVAILTPVQLGGTTVRRASLCNQDEIIRLGIHIGDVVYVEKSAEIIPKVMGLHQKGGLIGSWRMPVECPWCRGNIEKEPGKVAYRCVNKKCSGVAIERLKHALGKSALDWDGFGEEMVKCAVEFGITSLSQVFGLTDDKLEELFKPAFVKKFQKERQRMLTDIPLWRKIHALGIPGVGRSLSQDLCAKYGSIVDMADHPDEIRVILGDVFCVNFLTYIVENVDEIEALEVYGFLFSQDAKNDGPLTGKTFCITGGLVSGQREAVAAKIEKMGGTFKSSVSKKVEYLVLGEGGGANKAESAKKHGTKIITEEQLYEMMGIPMPKAAENPLAARGEL